MTSIGWVNKRVGDNRFIAPSIFEEFFSAWILLKPSQAPHNQFVTVKINRNCIELSVRNLKKGYGITDLELEFDPLTLNQVILEKIELLQSLFNRLFIPIDKIYNDRHEIWFSESLFKTLQRSLKFSRTSSHYSPLYTETPFSLTISRERLILDTQKKFRIDGHSSKNFHYSADANSPRHPLLRLTCRSHLEEFEREWSIYSWILATAREAEAPEGLLAPWCLLNVGENKVIYLPIGKPYVYIPLSPEQKRVSISLIKGLINLHSEYLVHGDPKLKNFILLEGKARWFDFGLSVPFGTNLKNCYTYGYQAPEYFTDKERNMVLLDIYALGVTLYEVHYGKRPPYVYDGNNPISKEHLEWCEGLNSFPLANVIKGFMHPLKEKRMTLKQGLEILEEESLPNPVF